MKKVPKSNRVLWNKFFDDKDNLKLQKYLEKNDAVLYYEGEFGDRNYIGHKLKCEEKVYHIGDSTLGFVRYENMNSGINKIILTVSEDEKIKKEIKELFDIDNL
ncbi:MAG: hypothetical protein KAT37_03420 [Candidatus Aenigmarchaeota archaeon]|nr:hypothetical protein [Candidatus Aenigmarchaeota archaeon]